MGGMTETGGLREAMAATATFCVFPSASLKSRVWAVSLSTLPARIVPSLRTILSTPKPGTIFADGSTKDSASSALVRCAPISRSIGPTSLPSSLSMRWQAVQFAARWPLTKALPRAASPPSVSSS